MTDSQAPLRAIALQRTPAAVIDAAVNVARGTLESDVAFAAVTAGAAEFPIVSAEGIRDPRWSSIVVRPHTGLGGEVLALERPMIVSDYPADRRISRHFVEVVAHGEGLRAVSCVPIFGADGIEALLYAGARHAGVLGDRAVVVLEQVAAFAAVGLDQIRARELELELARLRERELIARQIHDSVAQRLFTIGAVAQASRKQDDKGLIDAIDEIEATAADARRELRDTLLQLHDDSDHLAFDLQLDGELRLLESVSGCTVRIARKGVPQGIPQHIARLMIDAAVEGTRNAVKHTNARLVAVEIVYDQQMLSLLVEALLAASSPVRPAEPGGGGTGIGLRTLHDRAGRLGGRLQLARGATGGLVLRLDLPYDDVTR